MYSLRSGIFVLISFRFFVPFVLLVEDLISSVEEKRNFRSSREIFPPTKIKETQQVMIHDATLVCNLSEVYK
jgi:hypothetical protein